MASFHKIIKTVAVVTFSGITTPSDASDFLASGQVSLQSAEISLQQELAGAATRERVKEFKEVLRETYAALPKNTQGHLEHQTVRYVLHRFFVQQFGWFVKGLEPDGDVWNTMSSASSLKDWVPSYLLGRLEAVMQSRGVDLDDLAALAAALEDLIRQEAVSRMTDIYTALKLPTDGQVSYSKVRDAITLYLVVYLEGGNWTLPSPEGAEESIKQFIRDYDDGWREVEAWLRGVEKDDLKSTEAGIHFADAARVAVDVGARYASFNDKECKDLKTTLLDMQGQGPKDGRVRLADFYKKGLYSHWDFSEKIEYLRELGAIDESNASLPMVIIPNYLGSRPNCLESGSLYAVCCRNECEDLMGHLERNIAAPTAPPQRITELVAALGSDTVSAPRKLVPELLARLDDIAARHGGEINIHGRLFAQWMHHAFPNECPYPHEAGTTSPVTPDEWMGLDVSASEEDRQRYIAADKPEDALAEGSGGLPWSHTEELLGVRHVSMRDAERSLEAELSTGSKARVSGFMDALRATFVALPKNSNGHIGHQAARYALHRLFVQRHGWFIKGLEPDGDVWHMAAPVDSFKEWVPSYLLDRLEARLGGRGLSLEDLAALGSAMEDLIRQEAVGQMGAVYHVLGFPVDGELSRLQADRAVDAYLADFLEGNITSSADGAAEVRQFAMDYEGWDVVQNWARTVEQGHLGVAGTMGFATASEIAVDIGTRFSSFNDGECGDLKKLFMSMQGPHTAPGRVRLADFYRKGLEGRWELNEKVDYLRALGALDDSNSSSLMVITSNYIASRPNCLEATDLYSVCCRNECEVLMAYLERSIGAPSAPVGQISQLVSALGSDTVDAHRHLTPMLLARLDEISAHHGGKVPLHGRLFAQWMHHAFPNECPFPHEAGTTSPLTPDEWIHAEIKESEEERQKLVEADTCSAEMPGSCGGTDLPWNPTEELLMAAPLAVKPAKLSAPDVDSLPLDYTSKAVFRFWVLLPAILGLAFAIAVFSVGRLRLVELAKQQRELLALAALALVGLATNLLNPMLFVCVLGCGLIVSFFSTSSDSDAVKQGKDKCCV